ncbi:glucose dehydrogenase [FAD, quinone]-like [Calliopsis andreniformis]|uniref:glucose dehydrogenase [FAD, quinone]-like n=1 Tax=Calliopsis andreniformis TaxID=337506 RepID=UPI003FCCB3C7
MTVYSSTKKEKQMNIIASHPAYIRGGPITAVSRLLLFVAVSAIFRDQSLVQAQRKRYANIYGFENFNSTPVENILGAGMGALNFLFNNQQFQERAQPDMTPALDSVYDFIVVGAGTAGATIASRLTEIENVKVLLIEAGPEETLFMDVPILASFLQNVDEINWKYETEPSNKYCMGMKGHRCKWPRGKVMGGSSVLNYMIATRGSPEDYDRWAKMGNTGWAYKDVLKYFKKLENIQIPELRKDSKYHGTKGPVSIDYAAFRTPLATAFLEAGQEQGYPLVDYNGEKLIGFSYIQSTMQKGYRMSSNKAYLVGKRRRNLHVTKMSMVHRILIDKKSKRAVGVQFVKNNRRISVYANKEVILCAGAIGSAQLLMLSGVGPAEQLRNLGIDVLKDSRVGDNVMDHIVYGGLTFTVNEPVSILLYNMADITQPYAKDFLMKQEGPLTISGGCESIAFVDVDNPKNRDGLPNIELLSLVSSIYTYKATMDNFGFDREIVDKFSSFQSTYSYGIFPLLLKPKSKGYIRLKSTDVNVKPRIVANYLNHPEDVRVLLKGIRFALRLSRTKAMQKLGVQFYNRTVSECERYPFDSDDYWLCNARMQTLTIYHYSGSCKMGPRNDPTAVVDPTLKVIGIKGLRVADASIIPDIPAGHTNIPVFMIAEKLADMVKKEWGYPTD